MVAIATLASAQTKFSALAIRNFEKEKKEQLTRSDNEVNYIDCILHVSDIEAIREIAAQNEYLKLGAQVGNYVTAKVHPLCDLNLIDEILYVECAGDVHTTLDAALPEIGYDKVLSHYTTHPFQGKGVIVGIVDQGIQWDHIAFRNLDGSSRIIAGWNQQDDSGTAPQPYGYGSEYLTQEEILSAPASTVNTHATHVASIAGGSQFDPAVNGGIAREASFVMVDLCKEMTRTSILEGIEYVVKKAEELDMPCVINLSLGNYLGPHDGTSLTDRMMDEWQGEGVLIVGAMGNEGEYATHLGYDFDTDEKQFQTGFRLSSSLPIFDAWSDQPVEFRIDMHHSQNDTIINSTGWLPLEPFTEMSLPFFDREILVEFTYSLSPYNNRYNAQLSMTGAKSIGRHYFTMYVRGEGGKLDMWVPSPSVEFSNSKNPNWRTSDYKYTLGEIGGTGKRITSVGSYTSDTEKSDNVRTYNTLHEIVPTSSRGFTIDGRMKPEIVAPGCIINAAFNSTVTGPKSQYAHDVLNTVYYQDTEYLYGGMSGTSMATPMVTGTYALWLQAKPDLTPEEAKEILKQTARQDEFTTDPTASGYGKLDTYAGLRHLLDALSVESPYVEKNIALYPTIGNGKFDIYTFNNEKVARVNVYDTAGRLVTTFAMDNMSNKGVTTLDISHTQQGIYYIQVATDRNCHTYKYVRQ